MLDSLHGEGNLLFSKCFLCFRKRMFLSAKYDERNLPMDRFLLDHCPLFEHVTEDELAPMLRLHAKTSVYQKDSFVFSAGDPAVYIGVVLSGKVHVIQEDYWGNRSILTSLLPGELFGEAFACAQVEFFPVSVMVSEPSSVLLLDYRNMFTLHAASYSFHAKLVQNMTKIWRKRTLCSPEK